MGAAALVTLVGVGAVTSFAGCQGDDTEGDDINGKGTQDAGARHDSGEPAAGEDAANGSGDTDLAPDGGTGGSQRDAHVVVAAEAGPTADDAGSPPPTCAPHGTACSDDTGALPCCTDTCLNNFCGCLPEGAKLPDGGTGVCCNNLATTADGYCGTNACVPDGTACGNVDGGVVCCNDDCNGTTCGGT